MERWSYVLAHLERYAEMQAGQRDAQLAREAALGLKKERCVYEPESVAAVVSCGSAGLEAATACGGSCVATCGAASQ